MTAENVFARFPTFIREYIYAHGWDELRQTQLDAARVIFDTDDNLLLASSTASGKTEAVFFPILTELCELPMCSDGIKVLYIAPLKSLINDQFGRMEDLLDQSGIPVFHWHGDVGASSKTKLLKDPEGILQITPESLESMLINRANDIPRLFSALRYVVIDEIHTMIGSDRGNQVICLLSRLSRLAGCHPRRIGLSATIGDPEATAEWLSAGSGRKTSAPQPPSQKLRWRLGLAHFFIQNTDYDQVTPYAKPGITKGDAHAIADAGYEYLYDAVKGRKALVFSNSREETELVTATLRQIAKARGEKDRFLIHHGNLSASLREDAEIKMKDEAFDAVTCATVTMELGIDIGKLSRVVQIEAPNSVSAFLQRLGRSGRRGDPPEMLMVFREETPLPNAPLPELIPWELLRAIAIVQLYIEKRFIEPPRKRMMPLSLAFHQTLSILASVGELSPRALAERVLSLPPMRNLDKEMYRALLVSMVQNEYLAMTDEGGLIVGLTGEKIIGSYKFYAVFKDSEDYTVRFEAEEIGTITNPIPKGERFALAGRVWEVEDVDVQRRLIYVHPIEGKMEISWPGDSGEVHTAILRRMREILFEDTAYPYLLPNAKERLNAARHTARATGMNKSPFLAFSDTAGCLFPWLGTRAFRTLKRFLQTRASALGISNVASFGCYYITFKLSHGEKEQFMQKLISLISKDGIDPLTLIPDSETPITDKYDDYIPSELLRRAYAKDKLSPEEVMTYFVAEHQKGGRDMNGLYEVLAPFYAEFNSDVSYPRMAEYVKKRFSECFSGDVKDVLDLGCGSGNMTFPLKACGYSMIGVDVSEDMLAQARATDKENSVLWLCQDMRSFELYGTVEGVVSSLDCINHLLSKNDVLKCFSLVHNYLVPDGIFIFDVNSPYKFREIYGQNSYVIENENAFCVWQNFFSQRSGRCHFAVDLFECLPSGNYQRQSADREEQMYTERQIRKMLADTGFTVLSVTDDYTDAPPSETTERLTFVAKAEK